MSSFPAPPVSSCLFFTTGGATALTLTHWLTQCWLSAYDVPGTVINGAATSPPITTVSSHSYVDGDPPPPPQRPETRRCHRGWRGASRWTWRPQAAAECPWTSAGRGGGPREGSFASHLPAQGCRSHSVALPGAPQLLGHLCSCFTLCCQGPHTGIMTSTSTQDPEGTWRLLHKGSQSWKDAQGVSS